MEKQRKTAAFLRAPKADASSTRFLRDVTFRCLRFWGNTRMIPSKRRASHAQLRVRLAGVIPEHVGIIGGADGPANIFTQSSTTPFGRSGCSC